jgi:hypothetical protein
MTTPQNQVAIQGVTVASADYLNTLTQWVPTLSALRSFVGTGNMAVVLLGLSAPNDGGQSVFYWNPTSTAPDDGTNIVRPQGVTLGAWIRAGIIPGTGNPVQFLASGSITNAVCQINYVASGTATLVLKPTPQATSACTLEAFAYGGAITLQLAAGTDRINGGTAGASLVVPQGYTADIWNDGAGNYYVILMLGTAASNVVTSWNGRNGVVTMTAADITGAGGALAASSVSSFNTRTGAVTLTTADVTGAGGAPLASPTFTGTPTAPTPAVNDNTTKVATTAYVQGQGSNAVPLMDGVAAAGSALTWTRGDHIHPIDTSRAPVASPTFTGVPAAPTAAPGDNTTALATTAFVTSAVAAATTGVSSWNGRTGAVTMTLADVTGVGGAPLASPTFTGTVNATALTTTGAVNLNGAPNNIKGVIDGSNAAAGQIGEYVSNTASSVSVTTGIPLTITTISLTAGDWDIEANLSFGVSSGNPTLSAGWIGVGTGAAPPNTAMGFTQISVNSQINGMTFPLSRLRANITTTTIVNLVALCNFTVGTAIVSGQVTARRVR